MPPQLHLLRRIGEGGMGEVWLADDAARGLVALKKLRPELAHADFIHRFRAEFATLARLRHPSLVSVYDYHVDPDTDSHAYTMEYVQGLDFTAATGGLPPAEVCGLAEQVCEALEFVHSHDLVHGDVKAANLIVRDGRVKLMDFGLADHPGPGGPRGSLDTLAPEIIQGRPHDRRADLYALGAVLFEALTRHPPFRGPSRFAVLRAHMRSRPEFPDRVTEAIPEPLRRVVLRLLCKNPSARYFTAAEVAEALRAARGAGGRRLLPPAALGSTSTPAGREPALQQLEAVAREAARGAGTALRVVSGAAGAGKASVLRELRARLATRRFTVASASCTRHPAPFEIARRWMDELASHASPEWPLLRAALLAIDQGEREASTQAAHAIEVAARRVPIALFLENAEWAEADTTALVTALLTRRARVAVFAAITTGEGNAVWPDPSPVSLGPLDANSIAQLARDMTGARDVDPAFSLALNIACGGMPGAARACLRTLAAENALFTQDGTLNSTAPPTTGPGLHRVLEFLPTDARLAAEALSVSRRAATLADLALLAGLAPDRAAAALFDLEHRGFASREETRDGPVFLLAAPALAPAILAAAPPSSRLALHRTAATLARKIGLVMDEAWHLFEAGGGPEAVAAALAAASQRSLLASNAAEILLRAATDPSATPPDVLRAIVARIAPLVELRRLDEASAAAREVLTRGSAAATLDRDLFAVAAQSLVPADPDLALELLALNPAHPHSTALRAEALLAAGHFAETATAVGLTPASPRLRLSRARAVLELGRAPDALVDARSALDDFTKAGNLAAAFEAAACAADAALDSGDFPAATEHSRVATSLAARIAAPRGLAHAAALRASSLERRNVPSDALVAWRRAAELARPLPGPPHDFAIATAGVLRVLTECDRFDEALDALDDAAPSFALLRNPIASAAPQVAAARLFSALGDHPAAEAAATRAIDALAPGGPTPALARAHATRASTRLASGRIPFARADHAAARFSHPPSSSPVFDVEVALASHDDDTVLALAPRLNPVDPRDAFRLVECRARALLLSHEPIGLTAAVEEFYDLLSRARALNTPSVLRRAHAGLGRAMAELGLGRSARDHLRLALDLLRDTLAHVPAARHAAYLAVEENRELREAILALG